MKGKELQVFSFLSSLLPIHKFKRPRSRSGTVFERSKSPVHTGDEVQPGSASRGADAAACSALLSSLWLQALLAGCAGTGGHSPTVLGEDTSMEVVRLGNRGTNLGQKQALHFSAEVIQMSV